MQHFWQMCIDGFEDQVNYVSCEQPIINRDVWVWILAKEDMWDLWTMCAIVMFPELEPASWLRFPSFLHSANAPEN